MDYSKCPACSGQPEGKRFFVCSQDFFACSDCNTLWFPEGPKYNKYDYEYMDERGHHLPVIKKSKELNFRKFWRKLGVFAGPALEVGCATGISLKVARDLGIDIYGLEVNEEMAELIVAQGISRERVSVNGLKEFAGKKFQAVTFFDSFEHIPNPKIFLSELVTYLSNHAKLLIVIPIANSISRRLMGRYWPHYVVDHWVHYTLEGLETLFGRYNIEIIKQFNPVKYIPIELVMRYITAYSRIPLITNKINRFKLLSKITLHFNIGEIGLICRYNGIEKDRSCCSLSKNVEVKTEDEQRDNSGNRIGLCGPDSVNSVG